MNCAVQPPKASLLVVDDDNLARQLVARALQHEGFRTIESENGKAGIQAFFEARPDLVILDVSMPVMDGWTVLGRIREVSNVPVLMLTASAEEDDRVRGLRAGADDYVTKPFMRRELVARVEALLRRSSQLKGDAHYTDNILDVDFARRRLIVRGAPVPLTTTEFAVLTTFVRNPGMALSLDQLLRLAWNEAAPIGTERVKYVVHRLRKKINEAGGTEIPIEAVRGYGYRYTPPST